MITSLDSLHRPQHSLTEFQKAVRMPAPMTSGAIAGHGVNLRG